MPTPTLSETAKAAREQANKYRERISQLVPEHRSSVDDCVTVLREFLKQSGDAGLLALGLLYWESSFACAISQAIASAPNAPDQNPENG